MTDFGSVHHSFPFWLSTHEPVVYGWTRYGYGWTRYRIFYASYVVIPRTDSP